MSLLVHIFSASPVPWEYALVGADTGGLEGLRAQLLILVRDEVDAGWEFVDVGTLATKIKNADFRIRYTTVEARLRVWLVLAVAVAACWAACHFVGLVRVLLVGVSK